MKHKLNEIFSKLKLFVKAHKQWVILSNVGLFVIAIALISMALLNDNQSISRTEPNVVVNKPEKVIPKPKFFSPLTGVEVTEVQSKRPVTAIIIENSPDARPQSAIYKAGFVFESIAEGGITRYLTFFQETRPDPIGPVRSLRPYFTDWILAFNASVAHVGGSVEALAEASSLGLKDLDQFANGSYYYRTTDRFAPHNVYTDFDKLDALNKKLGYTSSKFDSFPRKTPKPLTKPLATKISVDISSFNYLSAYTWNRSSNTYKRKVAGLPMKDRETGVQIAPSVVAVVEVNFSISGDGRYHYDLVGSGKVTVFQDGNVQVGSWSKSARDSQVTFTDDNGNPIKFNPGQVWITAISPSQEVDYSL